MIKQIKLTNFQKHVDKTIVFTPGINVIVGESRAGKSSVFRALLLALLNESRKTNIVNWNAKFTEVAVDINNNTIRRVKGDSRNEYHVNDMKLTAFGVDIPEEVKKIALLDEINIQRQHDQYFLISKTAGDLGRYLNQLVGLEDIDDAFAKTSAMQLESNQKIKLKKNCLTNISDKMEKTEFIVECESEFLGVKKAAIEIEEQSKKYHSLKDKTEKLIAIESEFDFDIDKAIKEFAEITELEKAVLAIESDRNLLQKLISKYPTETIEIFDISELTTLSDKIAEERKTARRLESLINSLVEKTTTEETTKADLESAIESLHKIAPECPLCGRGW